MVICAIVLVRLFVFVFVYVSVFVFIFPLADLVGSYTLVMICAFVFVHVFLFLLLLAVGCCFSQKHNKEQQSWLVSDLSPSFLQVQVKVHCLDP